MSRHAKTTSKSPSRRRPNPHSKLTRVVRKAANRVRRLSAALGRVSKRAVRTTRRSLRSLKP